MRQGIHHLSLSMIEDKGEQHMKKSILATIALYAAFGAPSKVSANVISQISSSNTDTTVTYQFKYDVGSSFYQIFIDTDLKSTTGYQINSIGADILIENGLVRRYSGTGKNWSFSALGSASFSNVSNVAKFTLDRKMIGEINLCGESSKIVARVGNNPIILSSVASQTYSKSSTCAGTRDPLKQPFSSKSIWNMPIGSNAAYVPANLSPTPGGTNIWASMPGLDLERIVLTPDAPLVDIYHSSVGWSGGDRCRPTGGYMLSVPMPSNYIIANTNHNESAVFLMKDRRTLVQAQPLARCTSGGDATALVSFAPVDLYGTGITGAHGGSGLSAIGGSIRMGELRPGGQPPKHALKVNVYVKEALYRCKSKSECFRWPATTGDSYAVNFYGTANNNLNSAMKMGALLAIPASVNIDLLGLETLPAKQLAWTLQNYGAYIVDDTFAPGFALNVEKGPAGSKADEFKADWGFSMSAKLNDKTPWMRDMQRLVKALHVVNNNTPTSIGGGGTPRQPLAPEIAP